MQLLRVRALRWRPRKGLVSKSLLVSVWAPTTTYLYVELNVNIFQVVVIEVA